MQGNATPAGLSGLSGLTTKQAERLLAEFGLNAVAEEHEHPLRVFGSKFWAPVPWMLEAAVVLEVLLRKNIEAGVIAALLVFNAALSYVEESHAQKALSLLRRRISIQVRVRRDGIWERLPAESIVPGDLVHLRVGDIVSADAQISSGNVLVDHSAVTGESTPADSGTGTTVFTGGLIRRGEATAVVIATGRRTYFGKTAELVRQARAAGHLQEMIFTVVKYLVAFDVVLTALILVFAWNSRIPLESILPFCLMLLVASIPVALPATFTLASAIGTKELAQRGVLVSRLSAIEDAAAMDTLATDKTGTLTKNELSVGTIWAIAPYSETDVIRFASLASDEATQDPIDLAILASVRDRSVSTLEYKVLRFIPFDPSTKCSEAVVQHGGIVMRVLKGAPAALVNDAPALKQAEVGVAVANATDVAKAAASIVLTSPGLGNIVSAVETSRRIKIIKTIEIALFLSLGLVFTHALVVTPLLIALLLFTNDFVTMSIATDRVSFSKRPDRWKIRTLVMTAVPLAILLVLFSLSVLFVARIFLSLSIAQIQTLAFLTLVFGGQGTVYLVRERSRLWRSRPSQWMVLSSVVDIILVSTLAVRGILMASLSPSIVGALLLAVIFYLFVVDNLKI